MKKHLPKKVSRLSAAILCGSALLMSVESRSELSIKELLIGTGVASIGAIAGGVSMFFWKNKEVNNAKHNESIATSRFICTLKENTRLKEIQNSDQKRINDMIKTDHDAAVAFRKCANREIDSETCLEMIAAHEDCNPEDPTLDYSKWGKLYARQLRASNKPAESADKKDSLAEHMPFREVAEETTGDSSESGFDLETDDNDGW